MHEGLLNELSRQTISWKALNFTTNEEIVKIQSEELRQRVA